MQIDEAIQVFPAWFRTAACVLILGSSALAQSWNCGTGVCATNGPVLINNTSTYGPAEPLEVVAPGTTGNPGSNNIANVLGLFNPYNALADKGDGAALLLGFNEGAYYDKIAAIFESQNPDFLRPALGFFTMDGTYAPGSETEQMRLHASGGLSVGKGYVTTDPGAGSMIISGNVGIGTVSPPYPLSVKGTIGAGEVVVTNTSSWPDYVFESAYRLTPLNDVADYIKANHHLPDVPSAKEVEEKGVSLGEMQAKLLAKIEELTLHMIETEQKVRRVEQENRGLLTRNEAMEKRLVSLEGSK